MEISPILLATMLAYSFELGIVAGIFYDAQRVIRAFFGIGACDTTLVWKLPIIKKEITLAKEEKVSGAAKKILVFFGDFLSVAFAGVGVIIINYSYNNGQFRFFTVIGALVGFICYFLTVGRLTERFLAPLSFFLKYCILSFFVILGYPFKLFLDFIIKFVVKIYFLFKIILEKRRKRVYNINEKICLLHLAKNGFLNDDTLTNIKRQ